MSPSEDVGLPLEKVDNGNGSIVAGLAGAQHILTTPGDTHPLIDWNFVTEPMAGIYNRSMRYARGKTLGGSSARNLLAYHRGTVGSYHSWAEQVGDSSYEFEQFLPYFKKSCHLIPPDYDKRAANGTVFYDPSAFNDTYGGLLQVGWPNYASPLATWIALAYQSRGISPLPGLNSGTLNGYAWSLTTSNSTNGRRSSSQSSYLHEAMMNTGIRVYTQTLAKKILFTSNKTASGVLVKTSVSDPYTIAARKEVILSAGTFQSPQLLMLSGIGPSSTLQSLNIPVLVDVPGVGQNMQDQPRFAVGYRVNLVTGSALLSSPALTAAAAQEFLANATGPLTSGSGMMAFEKIPYPLRTTLSNTTLSTLSSASPSDWPELEYLSQEAVPYPIPDPLDGHNYATILGVLVAPLSRGCVTINTSSAADPPVIDPNFLADRVDEEIAVAGFKRVREIWKGAESITIGPEYYPGEEAVSTDAEILDYIKRTCSTIWHVAGTCKMGKAGDKMAVVDSKGKVFGVSGLSIVDASVFPLLPPGHPQSTVYALVEKVADDIKEGR